MSPASELSIPIAPPDVFNDQLHHFLRKRAVTKDQIADLRETAAPHFAQ